MLKGKLKVLVTGGAGYIGSHVVVELVKAGFFPIIVDNLCNSSAQAIARIRKTLLTIACSKGEKQAACDSFLFYNYDLCNESLVRDLFNEHPDILAVIHLAALKSVTASLAAPLDYYYNNMHALIHVLRQMQAKNVPYFVFSSSCTVYGEPDTIPVTERAPLKPAVTAYGHTKQLGESLIQQSSCDATGIKSISLRYFNPIGADENGWIGDYPPGVPANLVPCITRSAAGKLPKLAVYGTDYDTPDGSAVRDYLHVTDLAIAHVKACQRLFNHENPAYFEVFNLGTGKEYSVLELIKTFEEVSEKQLLYDIKPRRAGDIAKIYADPSKANKLLGWQAERNLKQMLESAWLFQQNLSKDIPKDLN